MHHIWLILGASVPVIEYWSMRALDVPNRLKSDDDGAYRKPIKVWHKNFHIKIIKMFNLKSKTFISKSQKLSMKV